MKLGEKFKQWEEGYNMGKEDFIRIGRKEREAEIIEICNLIKEDWKGRLQELPLNQELAKANCSGVLIGIDLIKEQIKENKK